MIVVAADDDALPVLRARLGELGAVVRHVAAPSPVRRLALAAVRDEREAARIVATLLADGIPAVARPAGGARLTAWERHTRPVAFGARLHVCFAWSEHDRHGLAGLVELGPGGFGGGQHPSTRLVIEELLDGIHGGERVLDVGCGSGVLGLCALELGAAHVTALDVDVAAVEATRRNAALNGVDGRLVATEAPLAEVAGTFDVVVANLGRAGLVELAPELVRHVAPGGRLVASGIPPSLGDLVVGYLRPLVELARRRSGDWVALVLGRP